MSAIQPTPIHCFHFVLLVQSHATRGWGSVARTSDPCSFPRAPPIQLTALLLPATPDPIPFLCQAYEAASDTVLLVYQCSRPPSATPASPQPRSTPPPQALRHGNSSHGYGLQSRIRPDPASEYAPHQGQRSPRLKVIASNGRMLTGSSSFALPISSHCPSWSSNASRVRSAGSTSHRCATPSRA